MITPQLRGTAIYAGIGTSLERLEQHLIEAEKAGINCLFTSLQLPESNKKELLSQFPQLTRLAHQHGIAVDADIGERTCSLFGLDLMDLRGFKQLGLDVMRLDYGYSLEQTVAISHNDLGLTIEINASSSAEQLRKTLAKLDQAGANKANIRACHNYYPKRYTGLSFGAMKTNNDILHEFGYTVGAFLASQTHRRLACDEGLPTLERHRYMPVFPALQELFLAGVDFMFMGDDLADQKELQVLAAQERGPVTFRVVPVEESEAVEWLLGRTLHQMQHDLEYFVRSSFTSSKFDQPYLVQRVLPRERGDVTIDRPGYYRYAGEINIVRQSLPADPRVSLLARVVEEDRPMLDVFTGTEDFRLIRYTAE